MIKMNFLDHAYFFEDIIILKYLYFYIKMERSFHAFNNETVFTVKKFIHGFWA